MFYSSKEIHHILNFFRFRESWHLKIVKWLNRFPSLDVDQITVFWTSIVSPVRMNVKLHREYIWTEKVYRLITMFLTDRGEISFFKRRKKNWSCHWKWLENVQLSWVRREREFWSPREPDQRWCSSKHTFVLTMNNIIFFVFNDETTLCRMKRFFCTGRRTGLRRVLVYQIMNLY